jgi:lipopolysaccharide/colanic/teichoic acid biosynthesis glycosyltransferase
MTNRKKLPQGCWVTAFSSSVPTGRDGDAGLPGDRARARHRHLGAASRGLLVGARSSGSLSRPAARPAAPLPRAGRAHRAGRRRDHILPQQLFRDALAREQTRADRFDQPFVLLLVQVDDLASDSSPAWTSVLEAITVAVGDAAVVGWFDGRTTIGAIVPQAGADDPQTALRRGLARRLDAETVARISIRSHGYSPSAGPAIAPDVTGSFPVQRQSPGRRPPAHYEIKRALDVAGSLALLIVLAPVLLVIAVLLKLTSHGPVLFRQTRVGEREQPFTMLKFRTMRANADKALHVEYVTKFIRASAQLHPAGRRALCKLTKDPRVTPIGRVLRKTSLDELPQLWNVLRGEMSLVGPRPPLPYEVEHYRLWHRRRVAEARPGLTGLWQVVRRRRTTFDEMVRLDLRYVMTCSLSTDIRILLATPRAVLSGKGAG